MLASLWEMDGALIIYDAATLREVKRLPMKKPVGKLQRLEQDRVDRRQSGWRVT